jgi:hypothetical protein
MIRGTGATAAASRHDHWSLGGAALRAATAYVLLTVALYVWGEAYTRTWCRAIEVQVATMQRDFSDPRVAVVAINGETLLQLQAMVTPRLRSRFPGIPPGEMIWGSTLEAHLHNHLILVMVLLAAWPAPTPGLRLQRLTAGLAATAVSTSLDLPFALTGLVLGEVYAVLDPDLLRTDAMVRYFDFLQSGGRLMLPLVAAGSVLLVHARGGRPSPS